MSRDQRPGKIRIIADPQPRTAPNRRHDDPKSKRRATPAAPSSAVQSRRWMLVPFLLFVLGFAAGGALVAVRGLIGISGL